jgi:HD-like signal output (HDOD) protein
LALAHAQFQIARDISYGDFERRKFGVTNVEATRVLLEEWQFPAVIVEAIGLHHLDTPAALSNRLAGVINIAGEIAATIGFGLPGDAVYWAACPEKYETLGLTQSLWDEFCIAAKETSVIMCDTLKVI